MINFAHVFKTEEYLLWVPLGWDESLRQRLLLWSDQFGDHESIQVFCLDHKCWELGTKTELLWFQDWSGPVCLSANACSLLLLRPVSFLSPTAFISLHHPFLNPWPSFSYLSGFAPTFIFNVLSSCATLLASLNYSQIHTFYFLNVSPPVLHSLHSLLLWCPEFWLDAVF